MINITFNISIPYIVKLFLISVSKILKKLVFLSKLNCLFSISYVLSKTFIEGRIDIILSSFCSIFVKLEEKFFSFVSISFIFYHVL